MFFDSNRVGGTGPGFAVEVVEDLADDFGVDDESENSHPCPAGGAELSLQQDACTRLA
jgi:hypothetical protein